VHNLVGQISVCFADQVGTEPTDPAGTAAVDAALRPMRDTLAADGYGLEWSLEEQNRIGIQILATGDACADCLVAPETMRAIIDTALHPTPYTVGSITLPAA
jgi:hypothetical protein